MEIEKYKILNELGQGGMAKVYLANDNKFDANVAIKILNKEFAHNENIRKRFLAEARNMFKMSHPNIIKVTDLIEEGDTVAFVMEYIEGDTLKDYLERKGKLNNDEIKLIFSQMLEAVGYVHEQGLIHRDIKPSNFMISPKGQVKLLDFGIAKQTDVSSAEYTQTVTGMQMGTPMYMSPEQVNETKSVTAQSDIYSLGVVLWQMVMGQKPYDTKTLSTFQLQMKIVNEPLAITNAVWDRFIRKATAKEVTLRHSSAYEFLKGIEGDSFKKSPEADETIFEQYANSQGQPTIQNSGSLNSDLSNIDIDLDLDNEVERLIGFAPIGSDKFYFGNDIPHGKLSNFQSRIYPHIKGFGNVKFHFYYDDTIWGKGDDGWAIIRVWSGEWIFVIAPYKDTVAVFTLNYQAPALNRLKRIESGGLIGRNLNLLFENHKDNHEAYNIKYNVSAYGCGDFFEMLNIILEQ